MPTDAERNEAVDALSGRERCKNCNAFIKDNLDIDVDGKRLCKSCGFEWGMEAVGLPASAAPLAEAAVAVAANDMPTAVGAMGRFLLKATGELAADAIEEEAAKRRRGKKRKRGRVKTKKRGPRGGGGRGGRGPGRARGHDRGR
jgi:hypothetical protein